MYMTVRRVLREGVVEKKFWGWIYIFETKKKRVISRPYIFLVRLQCLTDDISLTSDRDDECDRALASPPCLRDRLLRCRQAAA